MKTKHKSLILLVTAGLFVLVMWVFVPPPQPAYAGGGDDHTHAGETPKAAPASSAAPDEVLMPKESQFLFDIQTQLVQTGQLLTRRTLLGQVTSAPGGEGRLVAPQAGRLIRLSVQVGQAVQAGQVLAVLEQTLAAPEQVGLASDAANAEAELRAAQQDFDRLQRIADIAARKDVIAAELRLQQARENASLRRNQAGNRQVVLRAPVSGIVDVFTLAVGQQVNAGDALLSVINPGKLYVQAQVYADDLADVAARGTTFRVEGLNGETGVAARVVSFSNLVNPANQARQLVLALDATSDLRPGQSVNVQVQQRQAKAQLVLPTAAVTDVGGKSAVFIHTAPEVFLLRFVRTGPGDAAQTTILEGLKEGERVVTRNTYQLKSVYLNQ